MAMYIERERLNFAEINAAVLNDYPSFLQRWIPGGCFHGCEYVPVNPKRHDRAPGSFKINWRTGKWSDFATGDSGKTPLSLYAYLTGRDFLYAGITLVSYYAGEAQRLHEQGYVDPDITLADRLLNWLQNSWSENLVSLPDIYQRGLNAISDKKTAMRIVAILEEHLWLVRVEGGDFVGGVRRKDVWRIVKQEKSA